MSTGDQQPPPTRPRTTGPKALTFSGIAALVLTIGLVAVSIIGFVGLLPLGVVDGSGRPGPDAIGHTSAPGSVDIDLEAGTTYAIWLLVPSGSIGALDSLPTVHAPGGQRLDPRVSPTADVSGQVNVGGTSARTVAGFRANETGRHTLVVPDSSTPGTIVLVAEDQQIGSFVGGILGTVLGAMAATFLGIAGVGMTVGGGIWWAGRRRTARAQDRATG